MKHVSILIAFCFLTATAAFSQPTLTAATSTPTIGLSDQVYDNGQFAPGNAGASQTWDFSTQTYYTLGNSTYDPCTAANNCTAFPGTTVVNNLAGNTYSYYTASATALALQGFRNTNGNTPYTNAQDFLRFPFKYGDSFVDSWGGSYLRGAGTSYTRTGVDSVSADGWGTLKTPAGTFTNTLRVRSVSTYKDSGINAGMPETIKYKSDTYVWYDLAHRDFLFTTASISVTKLSTGTSTVKYARYTVNQSVGIESAASVGLNWLVAPNPATGKVQIALSLPSGASVSGSLMDVTGRIVRNLPSTSLPAGDSRISLPADGLCPGIYSLRIIAGDAIAVKTVVIE